MPRILMLLEPQPIRNTFGAMAWIGDRFLEMLLAEGSGSSVADTRLAGNAPTLAHLAGIYPAARPYMLALPSEADAHFLAAMADWHTVGLEQWTAIQLGSPDHVPIYASILKELRNVYPFDVVAYWGTNETLRLAAASLGIPMLWAEYGPTRPPLETRFCLDGEGINGRMTGRADLVLSPPDQLPTFPSSSLQLDVGHVSAYEAALSLSSSASAECFTSLMRFTRGRARVILVVGQLADDSSLISFGRGWTPTLVLREALERLTSPDTVFILRPHPAEAASFHNFAAGQSLRAEVDGRDDVMIIEELGDAAYAACIAVASEVVAVNSSVCFEAMLLGKPIRVLGSASYMPASDDAKFPMHARQLDCASIDVLLTKRFIVGSEFWTKAFWKSRAAAVMQHASFPAMLPRLPNAHARILGRCHDAGDGILGVDGIGPLPLHAPVGEAGGSFDQLSLVSHSLQMRGWALDPRTGGIPAGFIFTTGEHSIWSSALHARSDVARHLESPKALMAGFGINVSLSDMPSASHLPVRAYAVAVTGDCTPIDKVWWLDPAEGNFVRVSDST